MNPSLSLLPVEDYPSTGTPEIPRNPRDFNQLFGSILRDTIPIGEAREFPFEEGWAQWELTQRLNDLSREG